MKAAQGNRFTIFLIMCLCGNVKQSKGDNMKLSAAVLFSAAHPFVQSQLINTPANISAGWHMCIYSHTEKQRAVKKEEEISDTY